MKTRLSPAVAPAPGRLAGYVADLDSPHFLTRQNATHELELLAELAEPALRKALAGRPALESRRRIEQLLDKLDAPLTRPEQLRGIRAVEVLELVGTRAARELLAALAKGAAGARLTSEAAAARARLGPLQHGL
jgi:hypothetical protein